VLSVADFYFFRQFIYETTITTGRGRENSELASKHFMKVRGGAETYVVAPLILKTDISWR